MKFVVPRRDNTPASELETEMDYLRRGAAGSDALGVSGVSEYGGQISQSNERENVKTFFGILFVVLVGIPVLLRMQNNTAPVQSTASVSPPTVTVPETPFGQMTPAQHLERARFILKDGVLNLSDEQLQELDRHFAAIPKSAPESAAAKTLQKQSIEAAKGKYLERVREKYASTLEAQLQSQGFDIVVTQLDDELIVASDLLKDDPGRASFLATVRSGARKDFCNIGFRRVVLGANGVFAGTHTYSLNCK